MARRARPVGRTASGVLAVAVGLSPALPAGAAGQGQAEVDERSARELDGAFLRVRRRSRRGAGRGLIPRGPTAPPEAGSDFSTGARSSAMGRRLRHPVRPASSGPAARGQARDLAPDTRALSLVRLTNFSDRSPLAYAGLPTACGPGHLRPPAQPNDQAGRALGAASGRGLPRRVSAPLEAPVEGHRVGGAIVSTCDRHGPACPRDDAKDEMSGGRFRQRRRHEPVGRASRRALREEVAARGAPSRLAPRLRARRSAGSWGWRRGGACWVAGWPTRSRIRLVWRPRCRQRCNRYRRN